MTNPSYVKPDPQVDDDELPLFPLDALPKTFRDPVEEVMRHYRVSALLPATCALCINSTALGRGIAVKSNVRRTYANLYAMLGAASGTGKSVVFDEFNAPVEELQIEMFEQFGSKQRPQAQADLKLLQEEIKILLREVKKNPYDTTRRDRLSDLLQQEAVLEDQLAFSSRLYCVDFTSEALAALLATSGEQIGVLSDEGGLALYNMLGRYTKGDMTDDILLCKAKTVNGTTVDRVSRSPIILKRPCVTLLLLVQPDLLRKAFGNERLLVGGFLARCLSADSKMQIQYEDEKTLPDVDAATMDVWNKHIRGLVKTFRFADDTSLIPIALGVKELSRQYHNEIVDEIRDKLSDIGSFASRWVERAWEISLNLHAGIHGVDSVKHILSVETFKNAIRIARFFATHQLEVLQAPRIQAAEALRIRLECIIRNNGNGCAPITLRDLHRRHGLDRDEVLFTVKNNAQIFGVTIVHPPTGGSPSTIVFLQSNPPP